VALPASAGMRTGRPSMRDDQDHLGTKEHLVKGDPQATTFQVVGV
jgi:hypothetical protein